MNILKMLGANVAASSNQSLYSIISGLGLTTNLKLCLDAGDSASYDPSIQTNEWLDTSGNGYDFFRGSGTGGDSNDPTFNGTAGGLSSAEYWSFDGADRFTYDTANEAWMTAFHKNSNIGSMVCMFYNLGSGNSYNHFGDTSSSEGFIFSKNSANQLRVFARNSVSSTVYSFVSSATKTTAGWTYMGFGMDEPSNTLVAKFDTANESSGCTYTAPSSGNAQTRVCIANNATSGGVAYPNGARLACFAAWQGTPLTATNLTDIYNALKGRFGL